MDFRVSGNAIRSIVIVVTNSGGWEEKYRLADQLKYSLSAFSVINPVSSFVTSSTFSLGLRMVSPALGHQLSTCICVYLSSVSAGKTSSQNCNITNHMKNRNKLDDMKFYIRKINAERLELFRILDIDMNTDLNYR